MGKIEDIYNLLVELEKKSKGKYNIVAETYIRTARQYIANAIATINREGGKQ